jgi:hypothetical protein
MAEWINNGDGQSKRSLVGLAKKKKKKSAAHLLRGMVRCNAE